MMALIAVVTLIPAMASAQERFRVTFAPSVAASGGEAELALSDRLSVLGALLVRR
jgi:hypothetical protein